MRSSLHEDSSAHRAHLGLRVERRTTTPGPIELAAAEVHRIRVHIGDPVRGTCRHHRFRYTRDDIDLLPMGLEDAWHELDFSSSLLLEVSPALLHRAADDMGIDPARVGLEPRHQFRDPQIVHIARALDAERHAEHPSGLLYREGLGLALAARLLAALASQRRAPRGLSKPQLRRVTELIEAHLDEDLSLARLSAVAAVSVSHLKTLFKRSTGIPVHAYVVQRRVERARTLLQRGNLPASQVALESGFAHQSHMARCMRRVLGVTPTSLVRR